MAGKGAHQEGPAGSTPSIPGRASPRSGRGREAERRGEQAGSSPAKRGPDNPRLLPSSSALRLEATAAQTFRCCHGNLRAISATELRHFRRAGPGTSGFRLPERRTSWTEGDPAFETWMPNEVSPAGQWKGHELGLGGSGCEGSGPVSASLGWLPVRRQLRGGREKGGPAGHRGVGAWVGWEPSLNREAGLQGRNTPSLRCKRTWPPGFQPRRSGQLLAWEPHVPSL